MNFKFCFVLIKKMSTSKITPESAEITSKLKIKNDTLIVTNNGAETSFQLDMIGFVQFQIINDLYNCTLKTSKSEFILGFVLTESDFKIFETAMKSKVEFRIVKALVRDDNLQRYNQN
jgi:hypothetical protein